MIGAILGDIIGSPYEFDRGNKSKEFPFCLLGSVPLLLIMALPPVESTFPATSEPQIVLRLPCDEV